MGIAVGGAIFGCSQLLVLWLNSGRGVLWFLGAMISGAAGVACMISPQLSAFLCSLGTWWNGDFWWFVLSDAAMFCNLMYFLRRSPPPAREHQQHPSLDGHSYAMLERMQFGESL